MTQELLQNLTTVGMPRETPPATPRTTDLCSDFLCALMTVLSWSSF